MGRSVIEGEGRHPGQASSNYARDYGAADAVVLGHDVFANRGDWKMAVHLRHTRCIQAQDREMGGTLAGVNYPFRQM